MSEYNKNRLLKGILANGYFPKELPPCFRTESFARVASRKETLLEGFAGEKKPACACTHNLARAGSLHRRLTLVNPMPFFRLAQCISDNWVRINKAIGRSRLSTSIPVEEKDGKRAIVPSRTQSELVEQRARSRVSYSVLLKADIDNFYPSIYTHSIPWALHGKDKAKGNRGDQLIGNKIDRLVRNGQDEQTMGIPVGPDTSLVLAELVVSAIDKRLQAENKNLAGFRYYDDYELVFKTSADAECCLALLQKYLGEFELALNPRKTELVLLPSWLELPWVHEVRTYAFRKGAAQRSDLIRYFELVFELVRKFPDQHVVKYALTRLYQDNLNIESQNWPLVEKLLLQAMTMEPGGLAAGARILLEQQQLGRGLEVESIRNTLETAIVQQAPRGHASEIAWALWTAIALKVKLGEKANQVAEIDDSVIALLALDARERGLLQINDNKLLLWKQYMKTKELYGPQWLLCYEGGCKSWLVSGKHIDADKCFGYLKRNNVTFYETIGDDALEKLGKKLESMSAVEYGDNAV